MANKDQKTEKASPQRLKKAREEGKWAVSKEFVSAFQFMTFVFILSAWSAGGLTNMREVLRIIIEYSFRSDFGAPEIVRVLRLISDRLLWPALEGGAIIAGVALAIHLGVTRFGFSASKLAPSFDRFNPMEKIRNIPKQGGPAMVQAIVMLVVFSFVLYGIAKDNIQLFFFLPLARPEVGIQKIAEAVMTLMWRAVMLFIVFGSIDLFRQLRRYNNDMKMSKEELKDEFKQNEGNPQIKMRIRRIQRDTRRRRMMADVASATAVVVNPTHYAVAIRYNHEDMTAPVVVAKGKNYLALRIRQRATEHDIPLIENPPLAQALYKSVEVGQEIPPHLYRAVAEILAYIYQLMNRRTATHSARTAQALNL